MRVSATTLPRTAADPCSFQRRRPVGFRIGMSALLWSWLSVWSTGCGDDENPPRPSKDAGADAATDARSGDGDSGGEDSGRRDWGASENPGCGFADRRYVTLLQGEIRVFPASGDEDRTLDAVVTSVEISTELSGTSRVRLDAGEENYTIETSGLSRLGVAVGDDVELRLQHQESPGYPGYTALSLRVRGQLALFYTKRRPLPDGFSQAWGAAQCTGRVACLVWTAKALRLGGPCGDTVELPSNARGDLCGWEVVTGTLQEKAPDRVDDTCGSHSFVGIEVLMARPVADEQDAGL